MPVNLFIHLFASWSANNSQGNIQTWLSLCIVFMYQGYVEWFKLVWEIEMLNVQLNEIINNACSWNNPVDTK